MKEFMTAALPWLYIGIAVALFAVNHSKSKEKSGNYMTEGMCLGMCVGTALDGNGLIYGMLAGLVIGMCIKKER